MTDGSGPDANDGSDAVPERPALEPGMLRQSRDEEYWARTRRRRPVAARALWLAPIVVLLGLGWALDGHTTVGAGQLPLFAAAYLYMFLRGRLTAASDAADAAEDVPARRPAVDVRDGLPERPSFGRGTLTGVSMSMVRWGFRGFFGVLGAAIAGAELVSSWRNPDPVPLAFGAAAATGGVALGELFAGRTRRRTRAFLTRELDPVEVRVVGLRAQDSMWVLEPLDGRPRIVVRLYSDDEALVAGDVVHAWGDVVPHPGARDLIADEPRLALTGPFGTLWASKVTYDSTWPAAVP